MYKTYKKGIGYSYTTGFYPSFELINKKKDKLLHIYFSSSSLDSQGYKKICEIVDPKLISINDQAYNKLKEKDNDHVVCVFKEYEEKLCESNTHIVLVNPSDMGNLGNIMRSMLAFDYHDLAIITPSCDRFNPKVVRSSMGAFFSIRQQTFSSFEDYLKEYPREYYPFMLQSSKPMKEIKNTSSKKALVFGNEARGLDISFLNENAVRIEQSNDVDSLNLATAVVLACYYFKD